MGKDKMEQARQTGKSANIAKKSADIVAVAQGDISEQDIALQNTLNKVLETVKREHKTVRAEAGRIAIAAAAWLKYEYDRQSKQNVTTLKITERMIQDHCFSLVTVKRNEYPTFDVRVREASRTACLCFNGYNPNTKKSGDFENGYQLDQDGNATLPYNVAVPTLKNEVNGVVIKGPNNDTRRIEVPAKAVQNHYKEAFPGVVKGTNKKSAKDEKAPNNSQMITALTKYLKGLVNTETTGELTEAALDNLEALRDAIVAVLQVEAQADAEAKVSEALTESTVKVA